MNFHKAVAIFCVVGLVWLLVDNKIDRTHAEGFKMGIHYALKSNPPSEELEIACAGLWIGEQNKKYWKKTNAN